MKLLNPNQLEGHEGQLLQLLKEQTGFVKCVDLEKWQKSNRATSDGWSGPKQIDRGTIGMFVNCGGDQYGNGWIDFLAGDDRVLRIFFPHSRWMEYFIPWPRGGFIHK